MHCANLTKGTHVQFGSRSLAQATMINSRKHARAPIKFGITTKASPIINPKAVQITELIIPVIKTFTSMYREFFSKNTGLSYSIGATKGIIFVKTHATPISSIDINLNINRAAAA